MAGVYWQCRGAMDHYSVWDAPNIIPSNEGRRWDYRHRATSSLFGVRFSWVSGDAILMEQIGKLVLQFRVKIR